MNLHVVYYIPILTTLLSAIFLAVLVHAGLTRRSGPHLWWWALGVFCYGLGTALESAITLHGNTIVLTKAWYIAGALLGGYPLAQGTVYLLLPRRVAHVLSSITLPFLLISASLVIMSPVHAELLEATRPSGKILAWTWVRALTPFLNLYAFIFLIGGAILSAVRYARTRNAPARVVGNILIALGCFLPGMGGALAKADLVEALYIAECLGLILIWIGYGMIARSKHSTESHIDKMGN